MPQCIPESSVFSIRNFRARPALPLVRRLLDISSVSFLTIIFDRLTTARARMHLNQTTPVAYCLVIQQNIGFGEKRRKAVCNTQFLGALPGVICPAGTPAEKLRSLLLQFADVLDYRRHRDACTPEIANKSIVYINVNDKRRFCGN